MSSPASPWVVSVYNTPGHAYDVHVAGHLALVADGKAGLRIIDVSNLSAVSEIGHYIPHDGDVRGVDVAGHNAYLASGKRGLVVVDISDPRNPIKVGRFDKPRRARSIQVAGSYAYVGDLKRLRVLDISDPSAPREIASYKTPGNADDVCVVDATACIANYDAGLMILGMEAQGN